MICTTLTTSFVIWNRVHQNYFVCRNNFQFRHNTQLILPKKTEHAIQIHKITNQNKKSWMKVYLNFSCIIKDVLYFLTGSLKTIVNVLIQFTGPTHICLWGDEDTLKIVIILEMEQAIIHAHCQSETSITFIK